MKSVFDQRLYRGNHNSSFSDISKEQNFEVDKKQNFLKSKT